MDWNRFMTGVDYFVIEICVVEELKLPFQLLSSMCLFASFSTCFCCQVTIYLEFPLNITLFYSGLSQATTELIIY